MGGCQEKKLYVLKKEKEKGTRRCLPALRDPQQARPAAWCRRCGGEIYGGDGTLCPCCERERRGEGE